MSWLSGLELCIQDTQEIRGICWTWTVELLQSQLKSWYAYLPNFCFISLALAPSRTTPNAVAPICKRLSPCFLHRNTVQGKLKECDYQDFWKTQ